MLLYSVLLEGASSKFRYAVEKVEQNNQIIATEKKAPFIKYKKARNEYIKYYEFINYKISPPKWIKDNFLNKIGINLKRTSCAK